MFNYLTKNEHTFLWILACYKLITDKIHSVPQRSYKSNIWKERKNITANDISWKTDQVSCTFILFPITIQLNQWESLLGENTQMMSILLSSCHSHCLGFWYCLCNNSQHNGYTTKQTHSYTGCTQASWCPKLIIF